MLYPLGWDVGGMQKQKAVWTNRIASYLTKATIIIDTGALHWSLSPFPCNWSYNQTGAWCDIMHTNISVALVRNLEMARFCRKSLRKVSQNPSYSYTLHIAWWLAVSKIAIRLLFSKKWLSSSKEDLHPTHGLDKAKRWKPSISSYIQSISLSGNVIDSDEYVM